VLPLRRPLRGTMSQPRWLGDEKPPTRERSRTQPNERTIDVSIKCPSADRVQGRPSSATEAVECSGREGADTRRSPTNHEWKSKIERIGVLLFFSYGLGAARPRGNVRLSLTPALCGHRCAALLIRCRFVRPSVRAGRRAQTAARQSCIDSSGLRGRDCCPSWRARRRWVVVGDRLSRRGRYARGPCVESDSARSRCTLGRIRPADGVGPRGLHTAPTSIAAVSANSTLTRRWRYALRAGSRN
jgi:hypothetical protein